MATGQSLHLPRAGAGALDGAFEQEHFNNQAQPVARKVDISDHSVITPDALTRRDAPAPDVHQ